MRWHLSGRHYVICSPRFRCHYDHVTTDDVLITPILIDVTTTAPQYIRGQDGLIFIFFEIYQNDILHHTREREVDLRVLRHKRPNTLQLCPSTSTQTNILDIYIISISIWSLQLVYILYYS